MEKPLADLAMNQNTVGDENAVVVGFVDELISL